MLQINTSKFSCRRETARRSRYLDMSLASPELHWGVYRAPRPLAGGRGLAAALKNPTHPVSAFQAS